jgi:hypothetical protein
MFADMASTGERLVKWSREFTPNPQHREPSAVASLTSGTRTGRPVTSLKIWLHRAPFAPPPAGKVQQSDAVPRPGGERGNRLGL